MIDNQNSRLTKTFHQKYTHLNIRFQNINISIIIYRPNHLPKPLLLLVPDPLPLLVQAPLPVPLPLTVPVPLLLPVPVPLLVLFPLSVPFSLPFPFTCPLSTVCSLALFLPLLPYINPILNKFNHKQYNDNTMNCNLNKILKLHRNHNHLLAHLNLNLHQFTHIIFLRCRVSFILIWLTGRCILSSLSWICIWLFIMFLVLH